MNPFYNIFLRNWQNKRASVEQIELAVTKGILEREEADNILATTQDAA